MKKKKEYFIVTESNPNMKDPFSWGPLLRNTLYKDEKEARKDIENLIKNYMNLYVERWNVLPDFRFHYSNKEKNFYVDRNSCILEWDNIVCKMEIRDFDK